MKKTNEVASESGHWYCAKTGEPRYTIIGKNGKERPTRVTDAREHGFVPSVTTVDRLWEAEGLHPYFKREMHVATRTTPFVQGMSDDDYYLECLKWSEEHSKLAREGGTHKHGLLEKWIQSGCEDTEWEFIHKVDAALKAVGVDLRQAVAEKSFAHPLGFGGKVDAHCSDWVVDFKTKTRFKRETTKSGEVRLKTLAYDQHRQLAAYRMGLGYPTARCLNVFIEVEPPCEVFVHEWDEADLRKGWRSFQRALDEWKDRNDYDPANATRSVEEKLEAAGL